MNVRDNFEMNILRSFICGALLSLVACSSTNDFQEYFGTVQTEEKAETFQADDYPAIKWEGRGIVTADQMNNVLNAKHIATLGIREYLTGGKYKFIDEFTEKHEDDVLIHRIFQYRDYKSSRLFRDVDQDGDRFENYILVTTWTRDNGGCHHIIYKKGKTIEDVYRYVFTTPDTVIPKSQQPTLEEGNECK